MATATTPTTQEAYDLLCAAINEGASEIRYQDKWIKYMSLDEMLRIKAQLEIDLGLKKRKCKRLLASYNNGC